MTGDTTDLRKRDNCNCKVGSIINEYGFQNVNDDLIARWTDPQESESIRNLTEDFNREILRAEMESAGMELLEGRDENLYRLLTDDDTLEAMAIQARSVFEENGINVDQLEERFVSHQTIYRHLRNCLEADKQTSSLSIEKERGRVDKMRSRVEAVTVDSLSRLREGDKLAIDNFEVYVNLRVICESCGTLHDVADLLDEGGCECLLPTGSDGDNTE